MLKLGILSKLTHKLFKGRYSKYLALNLKKVKGLNTTPQFSLKRGKY